jgi:hypothetical protein
MTRSRADKSVQGQAGRSRRQTSEITVTVRDDR